MTIDEMIKALTSAKANSPLGGATVAVLCLPGIESYEVTRVELIDSYVEVEAARSSKQVDKLLDLT